MQNGWIAVVDEGEIYYTKQFDKGETETVLFQMYRPFHLSLCMRSHYIHCSSKFCLCLMVVYRSDGNFSQFIVIEVTI